MSFGLIIIIAIIAGLYYFGIFSIYINNLVALGNASESKFVRTASASDQSIFVVTPALSSRGGLIAILLGIFIFGFFPDGIIKTIGILPLLMGLMVFPIGGKYRKHATIRVNSQCVNTEGKSWPLSQIAALEIRSGSNFNTAELPDVPVVDENGQLAYRPKPTLTMLLRGMGSRVVKRSWQVSLRTVNGSEETVLCGGLTFTCAQTLRSDLIRELAAQGQILSD